MFDNESLEFLGDAVLGLVVADMLFREFPQFQEGQKSKVKATLVSTAALARLADRIGLGDHVLLGRGEEKTGGRRKQALLADTCEALIAAIYLDGGIEEATRFVLRESADEIARVRSPEFLRDFKSALQELLQAQDRPLPEYVLAASTGPDHDKRFHVEVRLGADVLAEGAGRTKKDAEQEAARAALDRLRLASSPNRGGDVIWSVDLDNSPTTCDRRRPRRCCRRARAPVPVRQWAGEQAHTAAPRSRLRRRSAAPAGSARRPRGGRADR